MFAMREESDYHTMEAVVSNINFEKLRQVVDISRQLHLRLRAALDEFAIWSVNN